MPVRLPTGTTSLPPLGGRLFLLFQLGWWALAAVAVVTLLASWIDLGGPLGIELLRTAKAIVLLIVSTILFRRRSRDPVAAMLGLAFLLWTISSSVDFVANASLPILIDRVRFLLFSLALLLFPGAEWRPGWTRHIACAIVATFLLGIVEVSGLLSTQLFLPFGITCVLAALAAMASRYHALDDGTQKQQLKWVLLGLVCGIALILTARAGAAVTTGMTVPLAGSILLEGLFQMGIVIIALGFLTSLLRYRLYDAEAAISRSAVYAALTLTLVGTFAASETLIELIGQNLFGMAIGNVSGAVAAAIAAMMLTPLHGRISNWAESHFQHDLVELKRELPDLLAVLSSSASVSRFAEVVLPRIGDAVHATKLALIVHGRLAAVEGVSLSSARKLLRGWTAPEFAGPNDRADEDPFPLRIGLRCPLGNIRAWLLLGLRPDGSFYGKDDLEAISEIVTPLQRALLMVAERETDHRRQLQRDRELRALLATLKARVTTIEARIAL